ncbi:uncharacterized protein [Littorina saxatilis]
MVLRSTRLLSVLSNQDIVTCFNSMFLCWWIVWISVFPEYLEIIFRNMPPRRAASRRVAEVTRAAAGRPRASNQTASQRQPGGFESATAGGEESATALAAVLAELRRLGERQETCQVAIVSLQKDNQRLQEAVSGDREAIASTSGSMTTGTSNSTLSGSVANLVNTITGTEYGEPSSGLILVE